MREINNRLELSEASAALVAIPRGNFTANFDILNELIEKIVVHEKVVDEDGGKSQQIEICKSFFSKVLKLLAFQGVWMFLYSQFPLFFPLSGKNKGKSYCTLSSSFAASRLASLLACA